MANVSAYDELRKRVHELQEQGKLSKTLSREEVVSFAYGNTVFENAEVTREMVENAYDARVATAKK